MDYRRADRFAGGRIEKVWFASRYVSEIGVAENLRLMLVFQIQVKVKQVKRRCRGAVRGCDL